MSQPFEVREDVYISNGGAARRHGDQFEHVITLSRDDWGRDDIGSHEHTTQHFPLYDGPQNDFEDFKRAVGATIKAIDTHDGSVLVHCQAGISRSSTVLITALAEIDDVRFDEAYNEVWNAKPSIAPHPELRELALEFLDEDGTPFKNPFPEDE